MRQRHREQLVGQLDPKGLEQRVARSAVTCRPSPASRRASPSADRSARDGVQARPSPSGRRTAGTALAQSGPHSGENGSASPTASMIGCSRSMVSVDDVADLVGFGGRLGGAVGIGEQLGEVDLDMSGDRRQAAGALPRRRRRHRSGDQHAFRHRLEPQIQVKRRACVDRDQLDADARRAGHGLPDGQHGPWPPAEPRDVDHERRAGITLRRHPPMVRPRRPCG